MIYTLTVNPAIDYVIHIDDLKPGEVNRSNSEQIFFGGKGINVSFVLNTLGIESTALGFIAGFTGDEIERRLKELDIKTDFVKLEQGNTRINVKLKADKETDINGQGPSISEDKLEEFFEKIDNLQKGDMLVIAGSVPNTLPKDIYQQIMSRLYENDIKFVVDATGDLLKKALHYKPFLIKPNSFELSEIVGRELKDTDDIVAAAKQMQSLGAKNVLVSMAADGAVLITENGDIHKIGTVRGKVKNSVGAGDSMVAGFLAGYMQNGDYEYALKLGTAAGGATAFSDGLAEKELIYDLIKQII